MARRHLSGLALLIGFVAAAGAVGCFLSEEQTEEADQDIVLAPTEISAALKSTVVLEAGCTATKVGPRHLLLAARCVADKPALAAGKVLKFRAAGATPRKDAGVSALSSGEKIFTTELYPSIDQTCSGCHRPGLRGAPIYFGADAAATYKLVKARGFHEPNSIYRNKGAHTGPSLEPEQRAIADRWVAAEEADRAAATKPGDPAMGAAVPLSEATVAQVNVHPSFMAKCTAQKCGIGAVEASDAKDVALIVLDADLTDIPSVPIDLDSVGESDAVFAIGSGCATLDATPTGMKTVKTIAVPSKSANHEGSPYKDSPQLSSRLGSGYVVTAGAGWRANEAGLCASDIGAPLIRGEKAAVVGVTSNFTTWKTGKSVPVTIHHTRVDTTSRVGTWLASLGATTTRSCSDALDGCVKHEYDGGAPTPAGTEKATAPSDAGRDGTLAPSTRDGGPDAAKNPDATVADPTPSSSDDDDRSSSTTREEDDTTESSSSSQDAGVRKKKKAATSGCSAVPATTGASGSGAILALGIALAASARRRRRPV
jgi:mono/diheme cytochrome c family protein